MKQSPPAVYFTGEALRLQQYGGVSRYEIELVQALHELGVESEVSTWFSRSALLPRGVRLTGIALPSWSLDVRGVSRFSIAAGRALESRAIRAKPASIVHHAYHGIPRRWANPTVVTVHDMIYELFPQHFPDAPVHVRSKAAAVQESDLVIADSESTKRDIVSIIGADAERVHVVPLAAQRPRQTTSSFEAVDRSVVGDSFLLFVGSRQGYKRFDHALNTLSAMEDRATRLVVFGGGDLRPAELEQIAALGLSGRVVPVQGDDDVLARHYRSARALLYTSDYEGFGLPLLEAMSYGCPVLSAHHSSLPEAGGSAALYVDWGKPDDVAKLLAGLERGSPRRDDVVASGVRHSESFSWARTAGLTLDVYELLRSHH